MSVSCGVVPPLSIRGRVEGTNFKRSPFLLSLRSRRLEVVGTRKNERARASPSRAPVLSFTHYFQTLACSRLRDGGGKSFGNKKC